MGFRAGLTTSFGTVKKKQDENRKSALKSGLFKTDISSFVKKNTSGRWSIFCEKCHVEGSVSGKKLTKAVAVKVFKDGGWVVKTGENGAVCGSCFNNFISK